MGRHPQYNSATLTAHRPTPSRSPDPRDAPIDRRLSVAPMMDCTDRHFRYLIRLVTGHALLYTEMVTSAALVHGRRGRLLDFAEEEHPIALQLGGSEPDELARCARFAADRGFDETNLNVGCPSDRVRNGRFGACLMAEPDRVARCVEAMIAAGGLPVTVKTRIGIDDRDRYEDLTGFVEAIAAAGCRTVIVHARKAWLSGLSPKQNREIPPLRYDVVYRLKADFPALEVIVNGGITSLDEVAAHNARVDGSMMGREAYRNPFALADADRRVFGGESIPVFGGESIPVFGSESIPVFGSESMPPDRSGCPDRSGRPDRSDRPFCSDRSARMEVADRMVAYARREVERGARLHDITRHMLGLFHATSGARRWRRHLSTEAGHRNDAAVIDEALRQIGG